MSDAYYSTPSYTTYSTPAFRYGQMTAMPSMVPAGNPLQLASAPQGNGYGYYDNVNGDGTGNAGGVPGGGYGSGPGYGGQTNPGTNPAPTEPDYTQPPPPAPPPTTPTPENPPPNTPTTPQRPTRTPPTAQQAFQRAFENMMRGTVGQKSNGPPNFGGLFAALDRASRQRSRGETPAAPAPAPADPAAPATPAAPAPAPQSALRTAAARPALSRASIGMGGGMNFGGRQNGPMRRAEGGIVSKELDGSWRPSPSELANVQPMPMPTIPADRMPMPMPRQRFPRLDPSQLPKVENPIYRMPPGTSLPAGPGGSRPPMVTLPVGGAPPPSRGPAILEDGHPGRGQGHAWGRMRPAGMKPNQMAGFPGRGLDPDPSRMGGKPYR